jgi:hypothetical protein
MKIPGVFLTGVLLCAAANAAPKPAKAIEPRVTRFELSEEEGNGALLLETRIPELSDGSGVGSASLKLINISNVLNDSQQWENLIAAELRESMIKAGGSRWFEVRKKFNMDSGLYYGESTCFVRPLKGKLDYLKVSDPDKEELEDLCVTDAGAVSWEYDMTDGTPAIKVTTWNEGKQLEGAAVTDVYRISGESKVWKKVKLR